MAACPGTVQWVPAEGGPASADVLSGNDGVYHLDTSVFTLGEDGTLVIDQTKGSLRFIPTEHLAGQVSYDMTITVDDSGVTQDFSGTGTIDITAVADKVTIDASGAGNEDNVGTPISVPVSVSLIDRDGSEELTGTIDLIFDASEAGRLTDSNGDVLPFNVVDGKAVYSIDVNSDLVTNDGLTWTINGLGFIPETHSDTDVNFTVRATSVDSNGSTETTESAATIDITAVADKVTITATDTGAEEADAHAGIPLDLSTALVDTDGSETLTLFITLPDDADARTVLVDKNGNEIAPVTDLSQWSGDGSPDLAGTKTWAFTFTADDTPSDVLDGLTLMPPEGVSDDIVLALNAVTVESDNDGDPSVAWADTQSLRIDIGTSAPTVTVEDGSFTLLEGTARNTAGNDWQTVDLTDHLSIDLPMADGSETLFVELTDLPSYVDVRYLDGGTPVDAAVGDGVYRIPVEALSTVAFKMNELHQDQNFTFKARALVHDADVGDSELYTPIGENFADSAYGNEVELAVNVLAQADKAGLSISGAGIEDTFSSLSIRVNPKDGEEVTSVKLTGIPDGMEIKISGEAVTIVDGVADLSGYDLNDLRNNLTFKAPLDSSTYDNANRLRLGLTVETTEHGRSRARWRPARRPSSPTGRSTSASGAMPIRRRLN